MRVVRTFPPDGVTGAPVVGGVSFVFDRTPDPISVALALSTAPPLDGRWVWSGERRGVFVPTAPLAFSTPYRFALSPSARAADGGALSEGYEFGFQTRDPYDANPWRTTGYPISAPDGNPIYVRLTRPTTGFPAPGVVLVPAGLGVGYDWDNYFPGFTPREMAAAGLYVVDFVPEGRGTGCCPTAGSEDYDGPVQQEDFQAVLTYLTQQPGVAPGRTVALTYDYGLVMAAGALSRHAQPGVYALMDIEGPSDRISATDGGTVGWAGGLALSDDAFWKPREPVLLLPEVPAAYLRFQGVPDHLLGGDLSAARDDYRAAQLALWRRLNDLPARTVMAPSDPVPAVTSRDGALLMAYLVELAFGPTP